MKMNPLLSRIFRKCIKFLLYGTFVSLLFSGGLYAQELTVSGKVTSEEDGSSIPGVNVMIKGTSQGTATDFDGNYSLKVPGPDAVLLFSYIGYLTKEETVGNRSIINVVMAPDVTQLGEIVVTAFGIEREKKTLTYAAQNIDIKEISEAKEANVINSLAGKVAGMDMIRSSGGVGSATRVVLRGIRSMINNNQPLLIIDGVPASGATDTGPTNENGGWQQPDGFSNLNPDDIESITVLKGANATALYGARAQNGAIVITTKKGSEKGLGVDFSTNVSFEKPMILTKYQNEYGQGSAGTYIKNSEFLWGPKLDGRMVEHWSPNPNWEGPDQYAFLPHPDLVKDFFSTGTNFINTLSVTTGNDKTQAYISYTNTRSQGIVPNNRLRRNNFNVRLTSKLSKKLSADAKLSYIHQEIDNRVATGDSFWNPMRALYRQPRNISLADAMNYEYYDNEGNLRQHYWNPNSNGGENVYWMINRTGRFDSRDRVIAMASLTYNFFDDLSLMVRGALDRSYDWGKYWAYADTYTIADLGDYGVNHNNNMEINIDFLLNYKRTWNDFSADVSLGGNMRQNRRDGMSGNLRRSPLKANLFSLSNASVPGVSDTGGEIRVNSLYAFGNFSFRNYLFLEATFRSDWSSTLPPGKWNYPYWSYGLNWVFSDMINALPNWFSFGKVRVSYAEAGNGTRWAWINPAFDFGPGGQTGYARRQFIKPPEKLEPERTKSYEVGMDLRFFGNRLGIDFTWYKANTFNQIIQVPLPFTSGYNSVIINAGNIQNDGVELTLNLTPVIIGDFTWDVSFNYARNENTVIEIGRGLKQYQLRAGSWMTTIMAIKGERYGQIFTRGFERDENGNVLINQNGLPVVTPGQTVPMGNYLPDWMGGLSNNFTWRNFNLSMTMDMRFGGKVFSFTEANLASDGFSDYTLEGRDGMVVPGVYADTVFNDLGEVIGLPGEQNTIQITSEDYWQHLGGRNTPTGELFGYDASYVRLREVVLGYNFNLGSKIFRDVRLSLYGRNLAFLYNASKVIDPNMSVGTGNFQGMEGFGIPTTRQYGFNLSLKF